MKCILYLSILLIFISCNEYKNDKIESRLERVREDSHFRLDSIESRDWDTLYVLTPYTDIESKFGSSISEKIKYYELGSKSYDHLCSLIFVKEGEVISCYDVNRNIADFSVLDSSSCIFDKEQIYYLNKKREVQVSE